MVNVAMIGAGGYAFELIKYIFTEPRTLNLIAVCSNPLRKSAGREFCEQKGIPVYPDTDALLENTAGKAEIIMVPTSIESHYPLAKKCIAAGFDVFLEKPPVAAIHELDSLTVQAQNAAKKVAVMFQHLYSPLTHEIKNRILDGEFGKVIRVRAVAGRLRLDSYFDRAHWAGKLKVGNSWVLDGTINNTLAHLLANQLYFASAQPRKLATPVSVQAELYHAHNIESEDTSSIRIITDSGVEIIFNGTLCCDRQIDPTVTIDCEKATIDCVNFSRAEIAYKNGRGKRSITNKVEPRTNMLAKLAQCRESAGPYPVDLQMCRPFTLCVNGAFESAGQIHAVDPAHLSKTKHDGTRKILIRDINRVLYVCHDQGKLFSEMDVPWARPSEPLNMSGYQKFPGRGHQPVYKS
jgi:predicted dehydrogenase